MVGVGALDDPKNQSQLAAHKGFRAHKRKPPSEREVDLRSKDGRSLRKGYMRCHVIVCALSLSRSATAPSAGSLQYAVRTHGKNIRGAFAGRRGRRPLQTKFGANTRRKYSLCIVGRSAKNNFPQKLLQNAQKMNKNMNIYKNIHSLP